MTIDRAKTIEMAREADCAHVNLDGDRAKAVERLERFAALVRAQVIEEAAKVCEAEAKHSADMAQGNPDGRYDWMEQAALDCAGEIRGMKSEPGHSAAADAGASTAPLPEGEPSLLETVQQLRALAPGPTVEANSQHWAGMDGVTAWHLIYRHADNWADIGLMMNEWLAANTARVEAASTTPSMGCACRWIGDEYVERCDFHDAWHTALHEWAERARTAEALLRELRSCSHHDPYAKKPWTNSQGRWVTANVPSDLWGRIEAVASTGADTGRHGSDVQDLTPASERMAQLEALLEKAREALRMFKDAAIDMRGLDFNLTTEQWARFHEIDAALGKEKQG